MIFSGVQPTGQLHLGNYLGAIKNWVKLQDTYNCIFCVVDMHAITVPQDPKALREATRQTLATYIACGINPENNIIYNQSAVSGHAELAWILGCNTPLGWLNRMTQFKEKAGEHRESAVLGLYGYPVLMAADILLYKATHVPVGEDQKQHLELARDIAGAFNRHYNKDFFPIPEPLIMGEATRVMSLNDGTKKMSKSDESDYSRIALTDSADTIRKKFMKAKSDSTMGFESLDNRPDAENLLTIYGALTDTDMKSAQAKFRTAGFGTLKKELAEVAVEKLSPITDEVNRLMKDSGHLDGILKRGAEKANAIAEKNLSAVKQLVGFLEV
ncbi:MAG: tryptophan--tRNA ligase [Proteobacteria bacterium]|nr:tryptophan--tRNA ligase [Pseudomonadota bacterium]